MNGVETGKYIREVRNDNLTQIVYISSKQEYAMELFEVRPMHFLVKPLDENQMEKVLDVYIKINGGKNDRFLYKKNFALHKIEIYKIMYFVRENRKVTMTTNGGEEDIFYESLEKIYERVKKYGFLFIHKSYIINYRYVKKISYDHVVMTNDAEFSISRSRRKEIRNMCNRLEGR